MIWLLSHPQPPLLSETCLSFSAFLVPNRAYQQLLAVRILIANSAHCSVIQLLGMAVWRDFANSFRWCSELLKPRILYFFVDNGAMNAPRYWQHHNERSEILATMRWTLRDIGNCAMMPAIGPCLSILTERWNSWLRGLLGSYLPKARDLYIGSHRMVGERFFP